MSGLGKQRSPESGGSRAQPSRQRVGGEDTPKQWSTKSGVKVSAPPPKKGLHVRLGVHRSATTSASSEREVGRSVASLPKLGFKASLAKSLPASQDQASNKSIASPVRTFNASSIVRKPRSQSGRRPRSYPKPAAPAEDQNDFLYILAQAGESLEREDRGTHLKDAKPESQPQNGGRPSSTSVPRKARSPPMRKVSAELRPNPSPLKPTSHPRPSPNKPQPKKGSRTMVRPAAATEVQKMPRRSSTSGDTGDELEDVPLLSLRKPPATTWKPQVPVRANRKEPGAPDTQKANPPRMDLEKVIAPSKKVSRDQPAGRPQAGGPPAADPAPSAKQSPQKRPVVIEDNRERPIYKPKVAFKPRMPPVEDEARRVVDARGRGFQVPEPQPRTFEHGGPSSAYLQEDQQALKASSSGAALSEDGSAADYSDEDDVKDDVDDIDAMEESREIRRLKRSAESQDDELTDDMDVKRQRRIEANREAARQTIRRKRAYYDGMVAQEHELQEEQDRLTAGIHSARQDIELLQDKILYLRDTLKKAPVEPPQGAQPWHQKMPRDEARRQYDAEKAEQQQQKAAEKRRAADERQRSPEQSQRTEQHKHPHPHRAEAQDRPGPGYRRDASPRSPGAPPEYLSGPPPGWHNPGLPSWMKAGYPMPMPGPGGMPPGMELAAMAAANGGMPPGFPPMSSQGFPGVPPGMPPPSMLSPEHMQMLAQGGPPPWSMFGHMPPGLAAHLAAGGPPPGHREGGMPPDMREAQAFAAAMAAAGHPDGPPPGMGPGHPGMPPMPPGYLMSGNPMLAAMARPPPGAMMPGRPG